MRARTLIVLLMAVIAAAGTTVLSRAWLLARNPASKAETAPLALPLAAKSILVARTSIARGKLLNTGDFVWQPWPEQALRNQYIEIGTRIPEGFTGWVARQVITAGEPITEAKIISPGSKGFLAAALRPGMRAVTIPINAESEAAVLIPGDWVDLIAILDLPQSDAKQANSSNYKPRAAQTVLEDVRIIALDQKLEAKPGDKGTAHTATLEVTPKEAEAVSAVDVGHLWLSVHSLADATPVSAADTEAMPTGRIGTTFTLDSEVSALLPVRSAGKQGADGTTVLRGGAGPGG